MSSANVAIVGAGHTPFGRFDDQSLESLIVAATREALEDAGISGDEVDAVYLGHFNSGLVPDAFAASLVAQADPGLRYKPATRCENACASGSAALFSAIAAIQSGNADVVLVVGAENVVEQYSGRHPGIGRGRLPERC